MLNEIPLIFKLNVDSSIYKGKTKLRLVLGDLRIWMELTIYFFCLNLSFPKQATIEEYFVLRYLWPKLLKMNLKSTYFPYLLKQNTN